MSFTETEVEETALEWLERLGYGVVEGPDIGPGEPENNDWLAANPFTTASATLEASTR